MPIGLKQTTVRDNNLKMTLDILRQQNFSSSELAKILHLSKQALSKITNGLIDLNLIKETADLEKNTKRGRKKVNYCINEEVGLFATIVFYSVTCEVSIANAHGKVIMNSVLPDCEFLTYKDLETITKMLQEILINFTLPLLCISIAVPGEINKMDSSIKLSTKFEECGDVNLAAYFEDKFHCLVVINNDINLLMLGERTYGELANIENALLLHIDGGIGGSICYNGEILDGDNGYAAEFGFIKVFKDHKKINVEQLFSINFIKKTIKNDPNFYTTGLPTNFHYSDVIRLFKEGNTVVRRIIFDSCIHVALLVENLFYIFDIKNILISGRITMLGDLYLQEIRNNLIELGDKINVDFCVLATKGIELGALKCALDKSFNEIITKRNIKDL